jgi:hypothetical protein
MAYAAPSTRATNDLITAAIWNQDVKDNVLWLKGMLDGLVKRKADTGQISNSTAETSMYSSSIPAGTLGSYGTVTILLTYALYNNSGSSVTYTLRLKLGSTTVASFTHGGAKTSGTSYYNYTGQFQFSNQASASSQIWGGFLFNRDGTRGSTSLGTHTATYVWNGNTSAENSAGALTLEVTIQMDTAHASAYVDVTGAHVIMLPSYA